MYAYVFLGGSWEYQGVFFFSHSVCARAMTEEPEAETAAKEPSGERK